MERTQFTFYESFFKAIQRLKKKSDRADAYDAISQYALYGKVPDEASMSDAVAICFTLVKPNLDASRKMAKGGRKVGARSGEGDANKKENEKEKEIEIEKEKENECYNSFSPSERGTGDADHGTHAAGTVGGFAGGIRLFDLDAD